MLVGQHATGGAEWTSRASRQERRCSGALDGPPRARFRADVHPSRHGVTLVRVHGDLDAAAAPELDRMLTAAGSADGARQVVLDLEQVGSAAAEVVDVLARARRTG